MKVSETREKMIKRYGSVNPIMAFIYNQGVIDTLMRENTINGTDWYMLDNENGELIAKGLRIKV